MPFPAALTAYATLSSLAGYGIARSNYKAVKKAADYQTRFYNGSYRENRRFWADYIRTHHLEHRRIRYPYRTGYNYNLSPLYSADVRKVSSKNAVASAYARLYSPFGLYQSGPRYNPSPMSYAYMYY